MGKSACIKRMVPVKNYSTNTKMEKKKTEWEEGAGLRIWNFQGWSKKLKIFSWNSPFSVNIIRTL